MEEVVKRKRYKHDDIPVIFFNNDSGEWEAKNSGSRQSRLAAQYKNQLARIERAKALGAAGLYESRAMRGIQAAEARKKGRRGRLPGGFFVHIVIALALFALVIFMLQ